MKEAANYPNSDGEWAKKPVTSFLLTPKGRERLLGYLNDEITMTIIDRQPAGGFHEKSFKAASKTISSRKLRSQLSSNARKIRRCTHHVHRSKRLGAESELLILSHKGNELKYLSTGVPCSGD
jgi:hypothetical protein